MTISRIIEEVHAKNLEAILLFVDFAKAFDSIHRRKMEQILLANGLPDETVAAIMMLYRNAKVKVCFDIVAGVLQGDSLAPYLFIICLDYGLRTSIDKMKENGFKLTKEKNRKYPRQTFTDADYTSGKYTRSSRNLATYSETSCCRHMPPCQCTTDGIYVL